ncbi:MAG: AI-2E family transporter, partial [Draconibacterium sp.]|nr:AI-2E family transporter [Draconibacterium sp.]
LNFIIPLLIKELNILTQVDYEAVLDSMEEPIINFLQFFSKDPVIFENQSFMDVVTANIADKIDFSQISDLFAVITSTIGELLIGFFSVSFITFFFLKEENMFREVIILLVPTNYETKVAHIFDSISYLLRRYFIGLVFEVAMVMLLVTIGLTIVGIAFEHAVVIGLFCGMFNVIPYLGPWMGAAVGLLIGASLNIDADFMCHTFPLLGWMVLVFGTVQIIDNILFQPLIYSSSVKAHPLEIFLVIITAGSLAGILGMILAIPVYTILRVIAKEFLDNMKIVKKLTENLKRG